MITNGANAVADSLLYGVHIDSPPQWKRLPRAVKQQLMKKLGEKNYNNIHDPRLYQDLDRLWKEKKEVKEKDIIDRVKLVTKVECAVCLETYDGNDRVTSLMCGHKFCSKCVFQHIHRLGERAGCPLCRRNIFYLGTPPTISSTIVPTISEVVLDRLRKKRQLQRKNRRERKREKIR